MVSAKINFRHMKTLAKRHVARLNRAQPSREVTQMLGALKRSIKLLDDCSGMGFEVTFASRARMLGKPAAKAKRRK